MSNQVEKVREGDKALSFQLKIGELIVINGARVRIERKGDNGCFKLVVVGANPRILVGRQIIEPEQATSPFRLLYLDLQKVFFSDQGLEADAVSNILASVERFIRESANQDVREALAAISRYVHAEQFHSALKAIRILIENHDAGAPGDWPPPRGEPQPFQTFSSLDRLHRAMTRHHPRR